MGIYISLLWRLEIWNQVTSMAGSGQGVLTAECWPLLVASSARKRARALGFLSWRRSSYFRGSVFTAWPSQTRQPRTWVLQRTWTASALREDWPSLLNRSFQSQAVLWQFTEKESDILEDWRALLCGCLYAAGMGWGLQTRPWHRPLAGEWTLICSQKTEMSAKNCNWGPRSDEKVASQQGFHPDRLSWI